MEVRNLKNFDSGLDESLNVSKCNTVKHVKFNNSRVTLIVCNYGSAFKNIITKSIKNDYLQHNISSFVNKTIKVKNEPIFITEGPNVLIDNVEKTIDIYKSFKHLAISNDRPIIIITDGWRMNVATKQIIEVMDYVYSFSGCEADDKYNSSFETIYRILKERK